jgi:hypothetical protein
MTDEQANVVYHGPLAEHDAVCSVYGCTESAVLEFGNPGIFQPCWEHQAKGFVTTWPKRKWWRRWKIAW